MTDWLIDSVFGLEKGTHLTETLRFFIFELPKVLLLLTLIIFFVGIVRSYFSAERTRKILEGKSEFTGNVLAALLGIVTPFCSCSAIPLFLGFVESGVPLGVTFSFLIAAPMLPAQLLLQNLLYDMSQIAIPLDTVDKEYIDRPRKWDTSGITRFILYIGPISSIFDYATFALMFFFFKASSPEHQSLFQSGWFVEGLLSQTLIVHLIRTRRVPFFQSWATPPVILLTLLIMTIGIAIPMEHTSFLT